MERLLVEHCIRIYVWEYIRDKNLSSKDLLSMGSIHIAFNTITTNTKIRGFIQETAFLTTTTTNFNGIRAWFKCPMCTRRIGCLYVHPYSNRLLCRHCHNLAYSCQNRHRESVWESFHKPKYRAEKIIKKLKKKWLRTSTRERLSDKLRAIEAGARIPRQQLMARLDRRLR